MKLVPQQVLDGVLLALTVLLVCAWPYFFHK
jgi:hypothetical protein